MHVERNLKIAIASTLALVILQGTLTCLVMEHTQGAAGWLDPRRFAQILIAGACTLLGWLLAWHFAAGRDEVLDHEEQVDASQLLDSVEEGVLSVDEAGTVTFANQAALSLLGYQDRELTGRDLREVLHHGAAGSCSICGKESCLLNAGFSGVRQHSRDELMWRKDGSSFSAEFSSARLRGRNRGGFVLTFRDVSGRREVEERLRLQGAALEAAAGGIIIADRQDRIHWVNQALCRLLGCSPEEVLGMAPQALLAVEGEPEPWGGLCESLAARMPWQGMLAAGAKDGAARNREVTVTPVLDRKGEISHSVWTVLDLPERRRGEEFFLSAMARKDLNRQLTSSAFRPMEEAEELRVWESA